MRRERPSRPRHRAADSKRGPHAKAELDEVPAPLARVGDPRVEELPGAEREREAAYEGDGKDAECEARDTAPSVLGSVAR